MPINFANVNISLAQFQAVSKGKYNAGEVKLTSETTIDKVNNRVHRTGLNKTDFSHQEVLAIKQAFVKALKGGEMQVDDLIETVELPTRRVLSALTVLELDGHVAQSGGKRFSLNAELLED